MLLPHNLNKKFFSAIFIRLLSTSIINAITIKYEIFNILFNSKVISVFISFLEEPKILRVEKYTFLDFNIIFIIKYEIKNNATKATIIPINLIRFTNTLNSAL